MPVAASSTRAKFGIAGAICGSIALLMAVFHLLAGPFESQKPAARSLAEVAVSIGKDIARSKRHEPAASPAPVSAWGTDKLVKIAAGMTGALAVILAAIGYVRREDTRVAAAAVLLGVTAIALQFVTWLVLIAAALLLVWLLASA